MFDNMNIGYITLNISFVCYLSLLVPQLIHNWKYRSTQHLSLSMHYVMTACYILDFLYGMGRDMQWQYKTVTIVGTLCLAIQHIQIYQYSAFNVQQRRRYIFYTGLLLSLLTGSIYGLVALELPSTVWIWAGGAAQAGALIFVIPQIIKNHTIQSTAGINLYFVLLLIFLSICDSISAWSLGWDWPSRYGAPVSIAIRLILLYQFFKYSRYVLPRYRQETTIKTAVA
jgi:hypothetical protein